MTEAKRIKIMSIFVDLRVLRDVGNPVHCC